MYSPDEWLTHDWTGSKYVAKGGCPFGQPGCKKKEYNINPDGQIMGETVIFPEARPRPSYQENIQLGEM